MYVAYFSTLFFTYKFLWLLWLNDKVFSRKNERRSILDAFKMHVQINGAMIIINRWSSFALWGSILDGRF